MSEPNRSRRVQLALGVALVGAVVLLLATAGDHRARRPSVAASRARADRAHAERDGAPGAAVASARTRGALQAIGRGPAPAASDLLDGGALEALRLAPGPPLDPAAVIPASVRLERARAAVERFARKVAQLEQAREAAERDGADTSTIDHALDGASRRLEIAQFAVRAIPEETGEGPR